MKKIAFCLILLPIFIVHAFAENSTDALIENSGIYDVQDALPEQQREISGEMKLDGSYDHTGALKRLSSGLAEKLREGLARELGFLSSVMAVIFLCSLAVSLSTSGNIPGYIETAGCCSIAYLLSGSVDSIISQAVGAVNQLSDYSRAALPAIFTASAACGAMSSAPAKYAASCLAIEVFMSAAREIIVPLIYAYLAVSLSSAVFDNSILKAAAKICKSIAVYLMTGICLIFSSYIALSGLIAGSTDIMAVKTAKTVISNTLPVVGGIISDAASVVIASASLIKNSAGIFCLVAICALCLGPFALLALKAFLYKAVACAAEMLPGGKISSLLNSLGTTMSLLLGLTGSCGIMLFISVMSAIKVVNL